MNIENIIHSDKQEFPEKKITELTYEYIRNDYYTDENGNRYRAPTLHTRLREVRSANHNKRTLNFLIDTIALLPIVYLLIQLINWIFPKVSENAIPLILFIVILISSLLYYVILEYKLQRTLGKYLTKTIVIDEYCEKPTLKQTILRTFYRVLTFGLVHLYLWDYMNSVKYCRGMHDRITNTWVVPKEEYENLKKLLKEQSI